MAYKNKTSNCEFPASRKLERWSLTETHIPQWKPRVTGRLRLACAPAFSIFSPPAMGAWVLPHCAHTCMLLPGHPEHRVSPLASLSLTNPIEAQLPGNQPWLQNPQGLSLLPHQSFIPNFISLYYSVTTNCSCHLARLISLLVPTPLSSWHFPSPLPCGSLASAVISPPSASCPAEGPPPTS